MTKENHTTFSGFVVLGYSELPDLQGLLFVVFLFIYASILTGNGLIIYVTLTDPTLYTPMYFFLKNLSLLEICYTSVTLPKMLVNLIAENKNISFIGCAAQIYFLLLLGGTECLLLAAMAYDRYVAICNPLHYKLIMSKQFCWGLVTGSLTVNMPAHVGQTYLVFTLPFCDSHEINNFFCDIPPLLELACADTNINKVTVFVASTVFIIIPFFLILPSYVKIISAIMKMHSAENRKKVFSTCSSHLIIVSLFYGSGTIVCMTPRSKEIVGINKFLSLFYTILVPMFNPIIYSLRNREVKSSLRKFLLQWLTRNAHLAPFIVVVVVTWLRIGFWETFREEVLNASSQAEHKTKPNIL
ncbi:olfactory receptor 10AG1-like [Rhineura floridana]|uniref:olfactory receptor 10AG1-like n=1 Tax=Rhineura floridana TaxID=261503 RepID=UPI002AC893D3|nr:olfactory receptor 10AG1-like [Rhineura floridana]